MKTKLTVPRQKKLRKLFPDLQPNEEERADDIQKGIEAVEVTKIVKQQYS